MRVTLAYGERGLDVELPDKNVSVIEPSHLAGLWDEQATVRAALRQPIGCPSLAEKVEPHHTVAITFPDITRPCPTDRLLPALLEELSAVPRDQIVLISGTGMHRANTEAELRRMVGDRVFMEYRVINHDAFDPSQLALAGTTARGLDLRCNSEYLKADIKILLGFIEPHLFAGFSGGCKAVLPGLAGESAVLANHNAERIDNPQSIWGVTRGNPIFEEIREAVLLTRPTFLMNVTQNRYRDITGVFFGEPIAAHDAGIDLARRSAMRPVPRPFDIVLTTNGGYPQDLNFYQTIKGLSAANMIVRDGGTIITASECRDGIPEHGNYGRILRMRSGPEELLKMVREPGFLLFDQWVAQILANILLRAEVMMYSSLLEDEVRTTHVKPIADVEASVQGLLHRYGPEATIAVLPHGPLTIPYVADEAGLAFETLAMGAQRA